MVERTGISNSVITTTNRAAQTRSQQTHTGICHSHSQGRGLSLLKCYRPQFTYKMIVTLLLSSTEKDFEEVIYYKAPPHDLF